MNQAPSAGNLVNTLAGDREAVTRGAPSAEGGLRDSLEFHLLGKKVLVLGVGNRLRGDDGLGPVLIDRLAGRLSASLLDAGDVPEDYLGPIEDSGAEVLLVLDAVDFGGRPGDVALLDASQLSQAGFSTHAGSLNLLPQAIPVHKRPSMMILAVQPSATGLGSGLSALVMVALDCIERMLIQVFGPPSASTR